MTSEKQEFLALSRLKCSYLEGLKQNFKTKLAPTKLPLRQKLPYLLVTVYCTKFSVILHTIYRRKTSQVSSPGKKILISRGSWTLKQHDILINVLDRCQQFVYFRRDSRSTWEKPAWAEYLRTKSLLNIYRVSQKSVPLLYKSVFQYDWTW